MKQVLVYGASGRMGRFIAAALASRFEVITGGRRDATRVGGVDRASALVRGVYAVVNCAGPFVDTARPLADACIAAGAHYLDLSTERTAINSLLDLHSRAKQAKVKIVPSAAAAGGLGAWARAHASATASLRSVDISYAHGSAGFLRPTAGTLQSFAREVLQMLLPENGGYHEVPRRVSFPPPFGLGHAIQTRGPDDIALPDDPAIAVRTWLSVDPGTALNVAWTAIHEPSLGKTAGPILTALWQSAATAPLSELARMLPPGEDAPFSLVLESAGPRLAIAAPKAQELTARIVELCLDALESSPASGVISTATLIPAREALRALSRDGTIRVFRDDRIR